MLLLLAVANAAACDEAVIADGPSVAVSVAPLSLTGLTDATYRLTVVNGDGQTVWRRQVTSTAYGDGAGAVSYVGSCDADANPNTVQVEVVSLADASHTLVAGVDYMNPAPLGAPLELDVDCLTDADVAVDFDVTFARPAQQGFFDVAVSFDDVFCSAKLDCEDAAGDPLLLLHESTGGRGPTAVFAFACTAGASADTHLYLSDLVVDCGGGDVTTVDPTLGPGTLARLAGSGLPDAHLFDALVSRGSEQLGDWNKRYWNVALGLATVDGCTLGATGTASDGALAGGATPANGTWPYIAWTGALDACTSHELDQGDGVVETRYARPPGKTFAHVFDGASAGPSLADVLIVGALTGASPGHFADGTYAADCAGYRNPQSPYVYGGATGDGVYLVEPAPGGGTVQVTCQMTVDGGGWTRVTDSVAASLDGTSAKQYLYLHAGRWYRSPTTTLAWSWSSSQQLTGDYAYFDGTSLGSYTCVGSGEVPLFGVGCSDGPGGTYKTLPHVTYDGVAGTCTVCQDQPNAFGGSVCQPDVEIYVR